MKKETNYKELANDLISILEDMESSYRVCYELLSLNYDGDLLLELGFEQDDIEDASVDVMLGRDPR